MTTIANQIKKIKQQIAKLNKKLASLQKINYNVDIKNNLEKVVIMENQENKINIFDVANYIIANKNIPDLTNLKLQKLIFYIYAVYLVKSNNKDKMFSTCIEAWPYGPVFPELYFELKTFRNNVIENNFKIGSPTKITDLSKKCIDYILNKYGTLQAWELAGKTHEEDPWNDAYKNNVSYDENIITDEAIFEYYEDKFDDFKI